MLPKCTRKNGGALLGEGTYGCVFHPSIPCENEQTPRKGVGKVIFDRDEADEEFAIMKQIQKIDTEQKYFNPVLHKCDVVGPKMQQHDSDSKNCRLFNKNKQIAFGTISQIIYKERGVALSTYQAAPENSLFTIAGVREYLNLAKGCKLLAKYKLIHRDLKPDNIIRTNTGSLIMIDFGLNISFDKVFSFEQIDMLEASYFVFPPEFAMCATVVSDDHFVEAARSHLNKYTLDKAYRGFKMGFLAVGLNEEIMQNQLEDYTEYVVKKIESNKHVDETYVFSIFEEFADRIDVWSMGMILLSGFLKNKQQNVLEMNCWIRDEVARLIRGCLNVNPIRRFSSKQLVKELTELIKSNGAKPTVDIGTSLEQASPKKAKPSPKKETPKAPVVSPNKLRDCIRTHSLSELKTKMRQRKLKVTGNKPALCERLLTYVPKKK